MLRDYIRAADHYEDTVAEEYVKQATIPFYRIDDPHHKPDALEDLVKTVKKFISSKQKFHIQNDNRRY